MPADTSQRPSGVAFSLPRILIVCSGYHCPYLKQCNEHEKNDVFCAIASKGIGSVEGIQGITRLGRGYR